MGGPRAAGNKVTASPAKPGNPESGRFPAGNQRPGSWTPLSCLFRVATQGDDGGDRKIGEKVGGAKLSRILPLQSGALATGDDILEEVDA